MSAYDYLPDKPAYNPETHKETILQKYRAWPIRTVDELDAHFVEFITCKIDPRCIPAYIGHEISEFVFALYTENDLHIPRCDPHPTKDSLAKWDEILILDRIQKADEALAQWLTELAERLPPSAFLSRKTRPQSFHIPLADLLTPGFIVDTLSLVYSHKQSIFDRTATTITEHMVRKMGYDPKRWDYSKPLKHPGQYPFEPRDQVNSFFSKTPFFSLFSARIPFDLASFKEHHWSIYARTGHGKSQLIQSLVLQHLKEKNSPGLIIIDSESNLKDGEGMLAKIERLALFETEHKDRLVVVDPRESPALNMFDVPEMDEEAENEILSLYNYIFQAIDADLTNRQGTAFNFLIRLMFKHPGATLTDLLALCEEGRSVKAFTPRQSRYWPTIQTLDPIAKHYFETRFFAAETKQTREQLAARLYSILSVRAFERMFTAPKNKLNLHECMEQRKVVLISTAGLGDTGIIFGRFILALAVKAAYSRKVDNNNPCLLFIDEAKPLLDKNVEDILTRTRKYGLFIRYATQHYAQLPDTIRAAANTNTTVKLCGGLSSTDARFFAADMNTTADFLSSTKMAPKQYTEFACFVQNHTETALKLQLPFGMLEKEPTMDALTYEAMKKATRQALRSTHEKRDTPTFTPGDRIQITLNGVDQYPVGVVVREVREHEGEWFVFVEGSETGIPEKDVRLFSATTDRTERKKENPAQDSSGILTPAQAAQPFKPDEDFR